MLLLASLDDMGMLEFCDGPLEADNMLDIGM